MVAGETRGERNDPLTKPKCRSVWDEEACGQVRTYWNTQTSPEDENYWEPYSYANQHDVNAGVDISTMFPLVNSPATKLGLGFQLLVNASATLAFKKYGSNTDNGSTVDFTVEGIDSIKKIRGGDVFLPIYTQPPRKPLPPA